MSIKAIAFSKPGPINEPNALVNVEVPKPELRERDLLVEVHAVAMNPVDTKVRSGAIPLGEGEHVIGWDCAGIVKEVGPAVTLFKVGDEVFYAGELLRAGTNSQLHAVDERIVGRKPTSLDFAGAAGFPLVSVTAWEMLFDSFRLREGEGEKDAILIIGGAGGVGSILIQLAAKLTKLTVIATASRPDTVAWVKKLGAHHVINHHESLQDQIKALNLSVPVGYVAALTASDKHFGAIIDVLRPRGHVSMIDDPGTVDFGAGKTKSLTWSWELMYTRTLCQTEDVGQQGVALNRVSAMIDDKSIIPIVNTNFGVINAANLITAHAAQEGGKSIGKSVLSGWE